MIKALFIKIIEVLSHVKWRFQYLMFGHKVTLKNKNDYNKIINKNAKNVFLVPHADDELIGNYHFILHSKDKSLFLYYGLTGSCNSIENKKIRDNEFVKFCKEKEIEYKIINSCDDLANYLPKNAHTNLFFPSCIDWHDEHRLISEYVLKYIKYSKNISLFWYSISVPIISKNVIYIEESKVEIRKKYEDFKHFYISQRHLPINRFILQEKINGKMIGKFAAENYLEISLDDLISASNYCKNNEKVLIGLKKSINNINKIRKESQKIYNELF